MKTCVKQILIRTMQLFGILLILLSIVNFAYLRSFTFSTLVTPCLFLAAGLLPWLIATFRTKIKKWLKKKLFKYIFITTACLYSVGLIFSGTMTVLIISASHAANIPSGIPAVILGARVINNYPCRQLAERLDAAYDYLMENPDAPCIVTGGKQSDSELAQSTVMKNYLVEKGIDVSRIYEEDQAWDTNENMEFSRKILDEHNLGADIALVTSDYHQFRSQLRAKQYGMTAYPVSSKTGDWWLLPQSFVREMVGFLEYILVG